MISRRFLRSAVLAAAAATVTGTVAAKQPAQTTSMTSAASSVTDLSQELRQAQAALKAAGFYKGAIDGIIGPETEDALRKYQQQAGLPQSGRLDHTTLSRLLNAAASETTASEAGTPPAANPTSAATGSTVPGPGNAPQHPGSGSPPSGAAESAAPAEPSAPAQASASAGATQSESSAGGTLLSLSPQRVSTHPDNPRTERGLVRATEITAQKLYSENGGTFAQIEDLLIDPANARVTGVIVDREDTSGNYTGERLVVPLGDIRLTKGGWIITNLPAAPQRGG